MAASPSRLHGDTSDDEEEDDLDMMPDRGRELLMMAPEKRGMGHIKEIGELLSVHAKAPIFLFRARRN